MLTGYRLVAYQATGNRLVFLSHGSYALVPLHHLISTFRVALSKADTKTARTNTTGAARFRTIPIAPQKLSSIVPTTT